MLLKINRYSVHVFRIAFVCLYILTAVWALHDIFTGDYPFLNNSYTTPLREVHQYLWISTFLISLVGSLFTAASRLDIKLRNNIRRTYTPRGELAAIVFITTLPLNVVLFIIGSFATHIVIEPGQSIATVFTALLSLGVFGLLFHIPLGLIVLGVLDSIFQDKTENNIVSY